MSVSLNTKTRLPSERLADHPTKPPAHADRLPLLRAMLTDPQWSCDAWVRVRLERTLADLSHNAASSNIDETAWSLLAEETERYLDYRRLGDLEAYLRGCARSDFRFTRDDWALARIAEAQLHAHYRHVRDSSYVPEPAPMFRIH
ncbi:MULTISPECIES: hypothetical protein [unclassified Pseudoxanthomonas]|jgi:hypothetical protein|uniref:hypothetical protein n=1 Tax=unclassified Pseudoxanthomonas TaxID=2645906 RepID=UPI00307688A0